MKYLLSFMVLFISFQSSIIAQQTDDVTLTINNYFQNITENPNIKNSSFQNSNIQSYVSTVQVGNENSVYINSLQTGDQQVINQTGNQNNYEYYNYYSNENSNLNVNQEGTLNSLQVFGENSMMKNAVINQKSSFKSIVIKNYTN